MFKNIFKGIGNLLSEIQTFFTNFFSAADRVEARVKTLTDNIDALIKNTETEIQNFKDFKFDPKWKTRVINVPIAIEQIKEFIVNVPEDLIDTLKKASGDLRALFNLFEHGPPGTSPAETAGALSHVVGFASAIDQAFEVLEGMVDDLTSIVDDIKQLREQVEGLDAFFLSQGRPRKFLTERSYKRI